MGRNAYVILRVGLSAKMSECKVINQLQRSSVSSFICCPLVLTGDLNLNVKWAAFMRRFWPCKGPNKATHSPSCANIYTADAQTLFNEVSICGTILHKLRVAPNVDRIDEVTYWRHDYLKVLQSRRKEGIYISSDLVHYTWAHIREEKGRISNKLQA